MPPTQPSFAALGVPADIVAALDRKSITEPFPIQAMTIPDALAGRDVCGKAPTGSGKTLAFGIGAVARLQGKPSKPKHPRVLVLTPTRELAAQVASELQVLATPRNLRVDCFYGGVGYGPQLKALSRGVDVAVCCPGRLGDLIERGSIRLDAVEIVILDEADRMADMGFLPDVKRILDLTPSNRQTLLFSATLDGDIDVLVRRYQHDPARHELEVDEDDINAAVHFFWKASSGDRLGITADVAVAAGPTIVFSRTKHATDRIARQLEQRGLRAAAIHGDRSQKQREKALDLFVRGQVDALVATDVAARGIHVDGVNAVVHFDPPSDAKDYTHRSGRTARAGATGVVVSLVTPDKAAAVKRLQRDLSMTVGTTPPDAAAITAVLGEPPARKPTQDRGPGGASRESGGGKPRPRGGRTERPRRPDKGWRAGPTSVRAGSPDGNGGGGGGGGGAWGGGGASGSSNSADTNRFSSNGSGPNGSGPNRVGAPANPGGGHKKKRSTKGAWEQRSPVLGGKPARPGKPGKPRPSGAAAGRSRGAPAGRPAKGYAGGGQSGGQGGRAQGGGAQGGSHGQRRGAPVGTKRGAQGSAGSRRGR
jgi:superfamily II DNA/RNA helicase